MIIIWALRMIIIFVIFSQINLKAISIFLIRMLSINKIPAPQKYFWAVLITNLKKLFVNNLHNKKLFKMYLNAYRVITIVADRVLLKILPNKINKKQVMKILLLKCQNYKQKIKMKNHWIKENNFVKTIVKVWV